MDKKKMCIYAVILVVCMLWTGCGQSTHGSVFEMDQDGTDTAPAQEEDGIQKDDIQKDGIQEDMIQVDRETLRTMLEEALASAGLDPVIEVTCSCTGETQVQQVVVGSDAGVPADDGKLNINTADVSALQDLDGIGEIRAQAIISYRESYGAFQSIEDIKQVDGIKDGVFNKIKDDISVG